MVLSIAGLMAKAIKNIHEESLGHEPVRLTCSQCSRQYPQKAVTSKCLNSWSPAESRTDTGKNANRRLRSRGLIPGVLYGAKSKETIGRRGLARARSARS